MDFPVWDSASSREVQDQRPRIIESPEDAEGTQIGEAHARGVRKVGSHEKYGRGRRACGFAAQCV
eukprot:683990-Pleurochrysis_carterae.AAC.1